MTVIAWDGKSLAADKRAVSCGLISTTTKIRRIGSLLVGACGNTALGNEMMAWVERGRNPDDFPQAQRNPDENCGLLVIDSGRIIKYESSPYPIEFEDSFFAIGSGRDFALAAMHCGKSAAEAVEIASLFECGCGNGVDALMLDDAA